MKLYYAPGACSLSPHIALREAGLAFDLEKVDLRAKTTESGGDFTAVNPKGAVPALRLDDGSVLTENIALAQYVADQRPESGLAPAAGTMERYRLQEWLAYVSTELHKTFSPLFYPGTPDAFKTIVRENLAKRFAFLDKHLASNPYLMGEGFTVADGYCFTILRWADMFQIDLSAYPSLTAYRDRVKARPKVREALEAEGLPT